MHVSYRYITEVRVPPVVLHLLLGEKLQASSHGLVSVLYYLLPCEFNFNNILKPFQLLSVC